MENKKEETHADHSYQDCIDISLMVCTMIIISQYSLSVNLLGEYFLESEENHITCPCCNGELHMRDHRYRIWKREGGEKRFIRIRRLQCTQCKRIHCELPDFLVPYKHYETEVIEGVLDGVITEDDPDSEDENGAQRPCDTTMKRWRQWLQRNLNQIEGFLRSVGIIILKLRFTNTSESLFHTIRDTYDDWLGIVCRIIYNSAGAMLV